MVKTEDKLNIIGYEKVRFSQLDIAQLIQLQTQNE